MTDSGSQPAAVIGGRIRGLPHGRQPTPTEGEVAANLAAQKYPAVAPGTPSNPEPKLGQLSLPRPRRPSSLRLRLRTPCRRLRPRTPSLAPTSHIASHTLSHRHPTAGHFAPIFFFLFCVFILHPCCCSQFCAIPLPASHGFTGTSSTCP